MRHSHWVGVLQGNQANKHGATRNKPDPLHFAIEGGTNKERKRKEGGRQGV